MAASPARVGRTAFLLGFAGLLPQAAAVATMLYGRSSEPILFEIALWTAIVYGGTILSFLGGVWWGLAMRRHSGQGTLVVLSVVPSLFAAALFPALIFLENYSAWFVMALGVAIWATLFVDRFLVATGEAPANWMRLRVPLSVGLGALTIAAGLLL